jgi:hypothetical protein
VNALRELFGCDTWPGAPIGKADERKTTAALIAWRRRRLVVLQLHTRAQLCEVTP